MKTIGVLLILILTATALGGDMSAVDTAMQKADEVFNARKYDESLPAYQELLELAELEDIRSAQVEALSQIARCHLLKGDKEACAEWLAKAEQLATPNDPGGWSRYLGVRGRLEWKRDDNQTAVKTFIEMFDFARGHDLNSRAIDAVHMVAIVGTPEQQIEWGLKGIELAEETGTTKWLGPLWNNLNEDVIGQASQDIGEITIAGGDKAAGLEMLQRARGCYEREGYADFAPDILEKVKARIAELSQN